MKVDNMKASDNYDDLKIQFNALKRIVVAKQAQIQVYEKRIKENKMEKELKWKPEIGERVWIKVFSNWSLGTYVGYDVTINKHYVREDADGGGHLMSSDQVLPESENPNDVKNKTAVEWLVEEVELISYSAGVSKDERIELYNTAIQQAKQMEKKEKILLLEWIRFNANEVPNGWQFGGIYYTDEDILNQFQK